MYLLGDYLAERYLDSQKGEVKQVKALILALLLVGCGGSVDTQPEPDKVFHCAISQPEYGRCRGQMELTCDGPSASLDGMECVSSLTGLKPDGAMGWCCK